MHARVFLAAPLATLLLWGCPQEPSQDGGSLADSGVADGGIGADGGQDAAQPDQGSVDQGSPDQAIVDPCAGLIPCSEPAWSCQGDVAVECWYDDNDCLVETRTDCATQPGGYCSTAGVLAGCRYDGDQCGAMGTCPAERYCADTVLHTCLSDADGCASVRAEQDCANEGKICVASNDGAECELADPHAPSLQIAAAWAAIDGATGLPLQGDWDIDNALVTSVKPPVGADTGGFFVQAEQPGPAIFVEHVDPVGVVEVGDEVSIWFDEVDLDQGRHLVTGLGWLDIISQGSDVSALVQEVSDVDVVGQLDDHEHELIRMDAQVTGAFAAAGSGFVDATLLSAGVTDGDLRLRVPTALSTTLLGGRADLIGCSVAIGPSPLWRYLDRAQATAMDASEVVVSCP